MRLSNAAKAGHKPGKCRVGKQTNERHKMGVTGQEL